VVTALAVPRSPEIWNQCQASRASFRRTPRAETATSGCATHHASTSY
jgi:hypothetical protein